MLKVIYNSGYSRIPVWKKDPNDVVGIVFTKDLIYVDPNENVPLIAFARVFAVAAHRIWLDAELGEVLSVFKMGSTHMALVYDVNNWGLSDPFYELMGFVTLEDIVEEILQSKIMDETDSPKAKKERQNCTDQIGFSDREYSDEDALLLAETQPTFGTAL
uniref:CBS domain-containing protein n=1 Tax=Peronospora matthiolae TaxID=2874970 RepID=A0AAV1T5M3_9STRA